MAKKQAAVETTISDKEVYVVEADPAQQAPFISLAPRDTVTLAGLMFAAGVGNAPIEFLRTGTFTDMHGRRVTIDGELLDGLVSNFDAGAAGQEVPIDILHQQAEAAGWIAGIWREEDRLFGAADWNELGINLVKGKIYRYLSATIDLANKVLLSISLCNFPAVKGLAPVSLKEMLFANGESLGQRIEKVRIAYEEDFLASKSDGYLPPDEYYQEEASTPWVIDVWDAYVVVHQNDKFWRVNYTVAEDGKITFDHDSAVEVIRDWVEAQAPDQLGSTETIVFRSRRHTANSIEETNPMSEVQVEQTPVADLQDNVAPAAAPAQLSVEIDIDRDALVAEMRAELKAAMDRELAEFRAGLNNAVASLGAERTSITQQVMREVQEAQEMALFAHRVTSTGQFALPVTRDHVLGLLNSLPPANREAVREFIETVYANGTVDFREMGTAAAPKVEAAKRKLDNPMKQQLRMFVANGGTREQFFELNQDILGDIAQYEVEA